MNEIKLFYNETHWYTVKYAKEVHFIQFEVLEVENWVDSSATEFSDYAEGFIGLDGDMEIQFNNALEITGEFGIEKHSDFMLQLYRNLFALIEVNNGTNN
jgi:hypothetical protein